MKSYIWWHVGINILLLPLHYLFWHIPLFLFSLFHDTSFPSPLSFLIVFPLWAFGSIPSLLYHLYASSRASSEEPAETVFIQTIQSLLGIYLVASLLILLF